jgi:hypothetical protein
MTEVRVTIDDDVYKKIQVHAIMNDLTLKPFLSKILTEAIEALTKPKK